MSAGAVEAELRRRGIIAVLRAGDVGSAVSAAGALAYGGVTAIEVTYTLDRAAEAIRQIQVRDDLLVGAGTVTRAEQVAEAVRAGARFVVSPHFDPAVVAAAERLGVPAIPGAFTPTEIVRAAERCKLIKLFPAGLGGPAGLRAVREPLPWVQLVPTGGVTPQTVADWLAAGAVALGAGGGLCPPAAMAAGDWTLIEQRATEYRRALDDARAAH